MKKIKNNLPLILSFIIITILSIYIFKQNNLIKVISTESNLADAVDKLYDAVVVVENYQNKELTSTGTGFIYKVANNKAYIITNTHVITDASEVKINLTNKQTHKVEVVGTDIYSDIAVLSIDKDKIIKVAKIGSYQKSRLGDTLFTIGAPLDSKYSWTITRGILSGKDRLVEISQETNNQLDKWVMKVMQTDASINSGNSGGPIANIKGEVIGVTNMKLVRSGIEGMGFAIPIEDAIKYANILIKKGKIERPLLGVGTLEVSNKEALKEYDIKLDKKVKSGAVVALIQEDTPASKAGLKKGDIITKFGKYEITNSSYLKYYLYKYKIGDKVKCTYLREGKEYTVTITLKNKT